MPLGRGYGRGAALATIAHKKKHLVHVPPGLVHVRGGVEKSIFFRNWCFFSESKAFPAPPVMFPGRPCPRNMASKKAPVGSTCRAAPRAAALLVGVSVPVALLCLSRVPCLVVVVGSELEVDVLALADALEVGLLVVGDLVVADIQARQCPVDAEAVR